MSLGYYAAARSTGPPPVTIGPLESTWTSTSNYSGASRLWNVNQLAPQDGTVINVRAKFNQSGRNVCFWTMNSSRLVRDVTANFSSVAGVSDYATTLTIVTGDFIGCWMELISAQYAGMHRTANVGQTLRTQGSGGAKPSIGATIAVGTPVSGSEHCFLGTIT